MRVELSGMKQSTPDIYALLGRRIKAERTARHLTQQELAESAGMDTTHLSRMEHGKAVPSVNMLRKLADALGVGIAKLFQDVPPRPLPDDGWARKMGVMVRDMAPKKRAKLMRVLKTLAD